MTKSLGWYTAQELAGLPGMPKTTRAIQIRAKADWQGRKRDGSKAVEYPIAIFPAETQAALLEKAVSAPVEVSTSVAQIEGEQSPSAGTAGLNDKQRQVMAARLAFCREIERMMGAVSQRAAIEALIQSAKAGTLSTYLMDRIEVANDRLTGDRGLSERTLKRWLSTWRTAGRDEGALAPLRQRANLGMPDWLPAFLRCYQRPTKPSMAASYAEFAASFVGMDSAATFVGETTGGEDQEKVESLLARLLDLIQKPPAGGADYDFSRWAKEVDGVDGVLVIPKRRGGGTVDVIITGSNGNPSAEVIANCLEHILGLCSVIADVWVYAPTIRIVDAVALVELANGYLLADVQLAAQKAYDALLGSLKPRDALKRSQIEAMVNNLAGVVDRTVTSPVGNVRASDDLALIGWIRPGTLTLGLME